MVVNHNFHGDFIVIATAIFIVQVSFIIVLLQCFLSSFYNIFFRVGAYISSTYIKSSPFTKLSIKLTNN